MGNWLNTNWLKAIVPQVVKCLMKSNESARRRPIKLLDLISAFFILGAALAIFIFSLVRVFFKQCYKKLQS